MIRTMLVDKAVDITVLEIVDNEEEAVLEVVEIEGEAVLETAVFVVVDEMDGVTEAVIELVSVALGVAVEDTTGFDAVTLGIVVL